MNWKFWKHPEPPPPAPPVPKAAPVLADMSLPQWRKDPNNITALRGAFHAHPILKDWLAVAWAHIPRGGVVRNTPINATEAAIEHGRNLGYMNCLDILQACLEYRPEPRPSLRMNYPKSVEETFEEETV